MATTSTRRTYDPRFRQLIRETGDLRLAIQGGVPRSTARDWSQSRAADVVTLDIIGGSTLALERDVVALRNFEGRPTIAAGPGARPPLADFRAENSRKS